MGNSCEFANSITRIAIAQLLRDVGFDRAPPSIVDILSDLFAQQLMRYGRLCQSLALEGGHRLSTPYDVLEAVDVFGSVNRVKTGAHVMGLRDYVLIWKESFGSVGGTAGTSSNNRNGLLMHGGSVKKPIIRKRYPRVEPADFPLGKLEWRRGGLLEPKGLSYCLDS